MATLPVNQVVFGLTGGVFAGTPIALQAVTAGGDQFPVRRPSRTSILFLNVSGAIIYAALVGQKECSDGVIHDVGDKAVTAGVAVAAGAGSPLVPGVTILPIDDDVIDSAGFVQIRYQASPTNLKVAVIEAIENPR